MSPKMASALAQITEKIIQTQNALMLQMAALSIVPPQHSPNNIPIPTGNQFTCDNRYQRQRGDTYRGLGRNIQNRGRGYGAFSQARQNTNILPVGGQTESFLGRGTGTPTAPNPVKLFNNWNHCFLCGYNFKVEHTSTTCPRDWRKEGHQDGCTRNNVQ